jgi:hypothetical protein
MKYIITESKLYPIIDKIISQEYGAPLKMQRGPINYGLDPEYIRFFGVNQDRQKYYSDDYGDEDRPPFERNPWGMLWVNNTNLYNNIKNILGIDTEECNELIINYFKEKYNIIIKKIGV